MLRVPVYMDYNATTPCDPGVVTAMLPYFTEEFGNAASHTHAYGWTAKEAVTLAREKLSRLVGAEPGELIFTSGATEAINLALKGVFELYARKGNHIITCQTEHKAVLDSCAALERKGADITYLPVDHSGHIDLAELEAAITSKTVLIALMYANNETGLLHPVQEISRIARRHDCLFFSDATQAVGKVEVDVNRAGIDLMSFSGHKFYGPKGIGCLFLRRKKPRARVMPQIDGGGHENGFRSGTLNVPAIVGFGEAAAISQQNLTAEYKRVAALRDRFEDGLTGLVTVNGDIRSRLPGVSNLLFAAYQGNDLIQRVNQTLAVSSGSACTSARPEPSHVLHAMGCNDEQAKRSLRFSLGRFSTTEEVDFAVGELRKLF